MPNANYIRGAALERKIKKFYEEKGCLASRSAGSHGMIDVWATDFKTLFLVQCKIGATNSAALSLLKELIDACNSLCPSPSIPVALSIVQGFKDDKPIVLASKVLNDKRTKSKKS